jgi:sugar phosphate isomerase/epimerase
MKRSQVAAALYTVREHAKTPADVAATLKKVAEIGYAGVEVSGIGPVPDSDLAAVMADAGLSCCSTHEPSGKILEQPEAIAERLAKLGCKHTAYPHPGGVKLDTLDDVIGLAKRLNAAGKVFHDAGVVLSYHNHAVEFRRFDGRLMLEVILEETDPLLLKAQPDTFWIQLGGGDPVAWCRRLKGRLPQLHMKDCKVTGEGRPTFAEVGSGNLNWTSIIGAAEEAGCEWYVVEQDRCDGDPFDSLRMSFEYIAENLCS